ncbi:carbamoyl-phosphate synthase (glutamine-hydrolyzing) large subunit [Candidatus Pacearchaeota archaeon]|nr:carbamoyl-phosphate synthase (glutamine-hydrolyzing) large subunit [Candidatus Pacearchaeota archaeon]
MQEIKKVIILGSGALKIGEAGEFDYSGSQAIKALKEEGIQIILVNPNIATVQTDERMADKVYFLPVNIYFVEKIIEKERPDGILLGFGGQTALNCGLELDKRGILDKYNVKVLGTSVDAIRKTEDRKLFAEALHEIKVKTPRSISVTNLEDALNVVEEIGYPLIIRSGFSLGGLGSSICNNKEEFFKNASEALSLTTQILIEESLFGWKEIEYEVVRDKYDNCITVCNMENFDPLGIHTGESIVVAPSQTLTNEEYHKLRDLSLKVIRFFGIIGECNIQFALDPKSQDYKVIEVNARLSRSSALASKATGYPLAYIAAKLALGHSLTELNNKVTGVTKACFEPALDYCVVKIPRWDLNKFTKASKNIGSSMKSVGEVMAVGRKFEEALQKAIRMLDLGMYGICCNNMNFSNLEDELKNPTDERIFAVAQAVDEGLSIDQIYQLTKIDKWFLYKIKNIFASREKLIKEFSKESVLDAKKHGFSDKQISIITGKPKKEILDFRNENKILPFVKKIDTLAAEYPAQTNYLYMTYNSIEDDIEFKDSPVLLLGSGTYRIGSSVEFDWCCVNCTRTLKKLGHKTSILNYNPETVSTDYDECDFLFFEEISFESVYDIYKKINPKRIVFSMGGQIPNNLVVECSEHGMPILGTRAENIDKAEDRYKFSQLLERLEVDQPIWKELTTITEAKMFSNNIGYPVLVRPSYVLSGAAMNVAYDDESLELYLMKASKLSQEYPVVVSKYISGAKEIELDAVAQNGRIVASAITEHVENAGVHSGDATIVIPPQKLYLETVRRVKEISGKIAMALEITGPFNIQFIAKDNEVKVIECNLRASRSFPFISKASKINFIEIATKVMLNEPVNEIRSTLDLDYVAVKAPQFSFSRIKGADPVLGVEMASTGEVACFGESLEEGFLKAILAAGFHLPGKNILLTIGGDLKKERFLEEMQKLHKLKYNLYATDKTSEFLTKNNINNTKVFKVGEGKHPDIVDLIRNKEIDLVLNFPQEIRKDFGAGYLIRRNAVDFGIPLITDIHLAKLLVECLEKKTLDSLRIKSWDEYRVNGG